MNFKERFRRLPWLYKIIIATGIVNLTFGVTSIFTLSPSGLSTEKIYAIATTVLTVNATLFGLSAIAIGVFLSSMGRQKSESILKSSAMTYIGVSFASFWLSLVLGLATLLRPEGPALSLSISTLLVGAISGSIYIADSMVEFLNKK
jgi:hypothetical protein